MIVNCALMVQEKASGPKIFIKEKELLRIERSIERQCSYLDKISSAKIKLYFKANNRIREYLSARFYTAPRKMRSILTFESDKSFSQVKLMSHFFLVYRCVSVHKVRLYIFISMSAAGPANIKCNK